MTVTTRDRRPEAPLNILVVGLGVIGATYGYLFQRAGHRVEHLVRRSSARAGIDSLDVEILDGRSDPKGATSHDRYRVHHRTRADYDLIVVSVPSGGTARMMTNLEAQKFGRP